MKFMCEKHRAQLDRDPKSAMIIWYRLISLARHQADQGQWRQAIISYGNAMDVAEIIFAEAPQSTEVNRYVRTASELAYAMKQSVYINDLPLLVSTVKHSLEKHLFPADIQLLLRPVVDIAEAPLEDVHRWMEALFQADQSSRQTLH